MDCQSLMADAFDAVEYNAKRGLIEHLRREAYREKAEIDGLVVSGKVDPVEALRRCKAVFRRFKWKRNAVLKAKMGVDGRLVFAGKSVCGDCGNVRVCPLGPTNQCALFEAKIGGIQT